MVPDKRKIPRSPTSLPKPWIKRPIFFRKNVGFLSRHSKGKGPSPVPTRGAIVGSVCRNKGGYTYIVYVENTYMLCENLSRTIIPLDHGINQVLDLRGPSVTD